MARFPWSFRFDPPAFRHVLGQAVEGRPHLPRTRVVRVAGQLILQAGGEFVQSARVLFHAPMVAWASRPRTVQLWGVCS
ncbi:hypothetical protein [Shumkonia mesophila]|uniref:hypothetical protein n=1 Tax=Shumkonia mesophila TaxID=2838854 RepID=UPI0029348BC5|nr:hypothetical protein [Shumkonia mesophila]